MVIQSKVFTDNTKGTCCGKRGGGGGLPKGSCCITELVINCHHASTVNKKYVLEKENNVKLLEKSFTGERIVHKLTGRGGVEKRGEGRSCGRGERV